MNDTLLADSIRIINQALSNSNSAEFYNPWIWIALLELVIIIYLLFFYKKSESKLQKLKRKAKEEDVDFENIINSSFHVKTLYDELKIKCHPDRFPNDKEKNRVALELFQEISKNKTDHKKLTELKEIAIQKLNIKF
ncbi:MAG: molecular chaperone DnaJ [Aureispira sp.]|nr:molecular chaperone DnaJ [Aureispira sp.]